MQAVISAAAGAGPSSAIASTNATNEPDSRRSRISTLSSSLPAASTNSSPTSGSGRPILGATGQHGAEGSRDEDARL